MSEKTERGLQSAPAEIMIGEKWIREVFRVPASSLCELDEHIEERRAMVARKNGFVSAAHLRISIIFAAVAFVCLGLLVAALCGWFK